MRILVCPEGEVEDKVFSPVFVASFSLCVPSPMSAVRPCVIKQENNTEIYVHDFGMKLCVCVCVCACVVAVVVVVKLRQKSQ